MHSTNKPAFEVGKTYKTRGGHDAKVLVIEPRLTRPVVALHLAEPVSLYTHNLDGRCGDEESRADLIIPEPFRPAPEFWEWLPQEYKEIARDADGRWFAHSTGGIKVALGKWIGGQFTDQPPMYLTPSVVERWLSGYTGNWVNSLFVRPTT